MKLDMIALISGQADDNNNGDDNSKGDISC